MSRERPILFSGPMVRAIRERKKTQTRRLVNPQPEPFPGWGGAWQWAPRGGIRDKDASPDATLWWGSGVRNPSHPLAYCPYGAPGDRLWVRETWRMGQGGAVEYAADDAFTGARPTRYSPRYRPSIHMPRSASRLLLEVVDVRVQQIHDITEEDALAEGCNDRVLVGEAREGMAREDFQRLWDAINGKRAPWASNPWVWALTFRKTESAT